MKKLPQTKKLLFFIDNLPAPFSHLKELFFPAKWKVAMEQHPSYQITYIISGKGEIFFQEWKTLEAGDIIIIKPHTPHAWRIPDDHTLQIFVFSFDLSKEMFSHLQYYLDQIFIRHDHKNLTTVPIVIIHDEFRWAPLLDKIRNEIRMGLELNDLLIRAHLWESLIELIRKILQTDTSGKKISSNRIMDKVRRFMEANYDRPLRLKDLGAAVHLKQKYFCELFSKNAGISPMKYLKNIRLQKARTLLESSDLRIGEIAAAVGFEDSHFFSRIFTHETGRSPRLYRQALIKVE